MFGLPTTAFDDYEAIGAFRKHMASLPEVVAHYEAMAEEHGEAFMASRSAFLP